MITKKRSPRPPEASDEGRVVREALRYVLAHRNISIVIGLVCRKPIPRADLEFIEHDLKLLTDTGIKITLAESAESMQLEQHGLAKRYRCIGSRDREELIKQAAAVNPTKLCLFSEADTLLNDGSPINNITSTAAEALLAGSKLRTEDRELLTMGVLACNLGIPRVHFISASHPDSLLEELFTEHGAGTLMYLEEGSVYKEIRRANVNDVFDVFHLLAGSAEKELTQQQLETRIDGFRVFVVDEDILGCYQLAWPGKRAAVMTHIGYAPRFDLSETYKDLVEDALTQARRAHADKFVIPHAELPKLIPTMSWFKWAGLLEEKESPQNNGESAWVRYLT